MKTEEIVYNALKLQAAFCTALNLLNFFGRKVKCGNFEVRILLQRVQNINIIQQEKKLKKQERKEMNNL